MNPKPLKAKHLKPGDLVFLVPGFMLVSAVDPFTDLIECTRITYGDGPSQTTVGAELMMLVIRQADPEGRPSRYPWAEWTDGGWHTAQYLDDFQQAPSDFADYVRLRAKRHGLFVLVHQDTDFQSVRFRFSEEPLNQKAQRLTDRNGKFAGTELVDSEALADDYFCRVCKRRLAPYELEMGECYVKPETFGDIPTQKIHTEIAKG